MITESCYQRTTASATWQFNLPVSLCPFHFSTSAPAAAAAVAAVSGLVQSQSQSLAACCCLLLPLPVPAAATSCVLWNMQIFFTLDAWYKQNFCTDNDIFIVRWRACQPLGPPTWGMSYYASMLRFALVWSSSWSCLGYRSKLSPVLN